PSGPKLPPPGFRPSIRPVSRTTCPSTEIATTRSAPLFRNSKFSCGWTARPRGSAMRSSSTNVPRRLPSDSNASSAPNPFPLAPDALVTRRGIVQHPPLSRTLGFFFKILDSQTCFPHHYGAPDDKASDAHGAREESEQSNEIEGEVLAGSCKYGPEERDQRRRSERSERHVEQFQSPENKGPTHS